MVSPLFGLVRRRHRPTQGRTLPPPALSPDVVRAFRVLLIRISKSPLDFLACLTMEHGIHSRALQGLRSVPVPFSIECSIGPNAGASAMHSGQSPRRMIQGPMNWAVEGWWSEVRRRTPGCVTDSNVQRIAEDVENGEDCEQEQPEHERAGNSGAGFHGALRS